MGSAILLHVYKKLDVGVRNLTRIVVVVVVRSKQLENREVIVVSSGGQHTVLIAKDRQ